MRRVIEKVQISTRVTIHQGVYFIIDPDGTKIITLVVPCRANLHQLLNKLFFGDSWEDDQSIPIAEEEYDVLKQIFDSQEEYKIWKAGLTKIEEVGVKATKIWLMDQIKILTMRKVMKG